MSGAPALHTPKSSQPNLLARFALHVPVTLLTVMAAHAPAVYVRRVGTLADLWRDVLYSDLGIVLIYSALIALLGRRGASKRPQSLWETARPVALATLLVAAATELSGAGSITLPMLFGAALLNVVVLHLAYQCCSVLGWVQAKRVLILGDTAAGRRIAEYFDSHPEMASVVVGFLDNGCKRTARFLGRLQDLAQVARREFVDEVVVALPQDHEAARQAIVAAWQQHLDIQIVPDLFGCAPEKLVLDEVGGIGLVAVHAEPLPACGLRCKRVMDVALSFAALLFAIPLMLALAAAIKLDSPGPVFYRALRAGRKGRPFVCYKLRTMWADAEAWKAALRRRNERQGPIFKIKDDPRITRVGRFLRRYSLDELPQLWNVLCGEMSLVGPRPHPLDDCARYSLEDLRRLDVTPGLTGAWQISARRDSSFSKSMALDLEYIENWSLWLDLRILLCTLNVVFQGTGT